MLYLYLVFDQYRNHHVWNGIWIPPALLKVIVGGMGVDVQFFETPQRQNEYESLFLACDCRVF